MAQLSYGFSLFWCLFVQALPFLLLGTVISSGLLVLVDEGQLAARLPRNPLLGAILGSGLGLLIPVGQYGNLPVLRRFLLQGLPLPLAMSFFLAAPTLNPFTLWSTWQAFPNRPAIVFWRVVLAWAIAMATALIFSTYPKKRPVSGETATPLAARSPLLISGSFIQPPEGVHPLHRAGNLIYDYPEKTGTVRSLPRQVELFFDNLVRELLELASLLALGCAIAAVLQVLLPPAQLLNWGQTSATQSLALLFLGFFLSLGSSESAFWLAPLSASLLSGSSLAFLLWGSMVDLKGMGLLLCSLRPKILLYLVILTGQLTFLLALLLNAYT